MTADLARIARADAFREVAREHRLTHEDAECIGPDYETRQEREERQHRERQEDAITAALELEPIATARWDREDRLWRETHTIEPSAAAIAAARAYMAWVAEGKK